ncbi:MAG TPA: alanine racemase [Methyloceanibacter sp.]
MTRASRDDEASASAILTIDLGALVANWLRLREMSQRAECAAVVKADAYGLGMEQAASALSRAGCKTFFVATIAEAGSLRALLPDATIYVLAGLLTNTAPLFQLHNLRPVLNSEAEVKEWAEYCAASGQPLPAAIHIDSGMNRLGLSALEVDAIAPVASLWKMFELSLIMSHLACSDEVGHPKNERQRKIFDALRAKLPSAPASLANSAGILLGRQHHYDMVRPGIAIYGGRPQQTGDNPFQPAVTLFGRILQVREVVSGETIGYGATRTLKSPTRIAVVAVGYADGIFRALSTRDDKEGLSVFIGGHAAPILGRVSMDLITVDVTTIPGDIARRGEWVELIGPNVSAQAMAHQAGTIDYEILTNLGTRALRRYIDG